jgi:hypothetical protein
MNVCLVSLATTPKFKFNQYVLNLTALRYGGVTEVSSWNAGRIKKEPFYEEHRRVMDQARGAGYWLWKPYIIRHELERMHVGDYVVYSDCGRRKRFISRSMAPLLERCAENRGVLPGVYIPQFGPNRKWTKRDCFVLTDCDLERYWNHCQIQPSFSVWQKNDFSLSFLEQWLRYCTDTRILTDIPNACGLPNFPDFIDHRHDQSILTNCALRQGVPGLGDPLGDTAFCKDDKNIDSVLKKMGVAPVKSIRRIALKRLVDWSWILMNRIGG